MDDGHAFEQIFVAVEAAVTPFRLQDARDLLPLLVKYGTDEQLRRIGRSPAGLSVFQAIPDTPAQERDAALIDAERLLRVCSTEGCSVRRDLKVSRQTRQAVALMLRSADDLQRFPLLIVAVRGGGSLFARLRRLIEFK